MESSSVKKNYIAVIAVYFVANIIFMVGPALNALSTTVYANESYTSVLLISTISSLCMIPGSLIAGSILGKISFRTMALVSMGGIAVFGVIPYFSQALPIVYLCRGVVGFCIGIGFPLQSTLVLRLFPDVKQRTRALGFGTISLSVGAIAFMVIAGSLADKNAAYPFLFHAIALVPLAVLMLTLKEPAPLQETSGSGQTSGGSRVPTDGNMPGYALFTAFMFAVIFFAFYPVLLNMSSVCAYENLGGAVVAGILSSLFTIGNLIGGLTFEVLSKSLRKHVTLFGLALWVGGTACVAFGKSIAFIVIGALLTGWAVQTVWPATVNSYADYVPVKKQSMASAVFASGMNIGCFCTTYFISGIAGMTGSDNPRLPIVYGFYIVLVSAVIWAVINTLRKAPSAS